MEEKKNQSLVPVYSHRSSSSQRTSALFYTAEDQLSRLLSTNIAVKHTSPYVRSTCKKFYATGPPLSIYKNNGRRCRIHEMAKINTGIHTENSFVYENYVLREKEWFSYDKTYSAICCGVKNHSLAVKIVCSRKWFSV